MKRIFWIMILLLQTQNMFAQDIDVENLPKAKKLDWRGSIGGNASIYNVSGIEPRSNPFNWNLYANLSLNILETWELPFSFNISQYQSNFTKPFYQFGISPRYKWATLHLGYRTLTFNPYTLNGHTFFGAGVELNPGKLRFAAMYGRFRPAVEFDTSKGTLAIPSFKRTGFGGKIGVGTANNFVDLIFFKAKDDGSSIGNYETPELQNKMPNGPLTPAENIAAGLSSQLTFFKKLRLTVDVGISAYTRDIRDTFLVQDFAVFRANSTTRVNWAGKASLGYSFPNFSISAQYERVLPDFSTMGSYFFNNDFENFTLNPTAILFQGKVTFNASGGLQRNNLLGDRANTTSRIIGNANLSIIPKPTWGMNLNYNNFVINQIAGTVPVNDSFVVKQVNQTFGFTPFLTIMKDTAHTHTFNLNVNVQNVNDRNVITRAYGNMNTYVMALNHTTSFNRKGNAINSGLNYNHIESALFNNDQIGATLGYSHPLFDNKLATSASVNYNFSSVNGAADGSVINGTVAAALRAGKRHSFSLSCNVIRTESIQYQSYTEVLGTVGYNLTLK